VIDTELGRSPFARSMGGQARETLYCSAVQERQNTLWTMYEACLERSGPQGACGISHASKLLGVQCILWLVPCLRWTRLLHASPGNRAKAANFDCVAEDELFSPFREDLGGRLLSLQKKKKKWLVHLKRSMEREMSGSGRRR